MNKLVAILYVTLLGPFSSYPGRLNDSWWTSPLPRKMVILSCLRLTGSPKVWPSPADLPPLLCRTVSPPLHIHIPFGPKLAPHKPLALSQTKGYLPGYLLCAEPGNRRINRS